MRGKSLLPSWNWLNWTVAGVPTTGLGTAVAAHTPGCPVTTIATAYVKTHLLLNFALRVCSSQTPAPRMQIARQNPTSYDTTFG